MTRKPVGRAVLGALALAGLLGAAEASAQQPSGTPAPQPSGAPAQEAAGLAAENAKFAAEVREAIKGREQAPAKEVFKNLKNMGEVPAGRLIGTMEGAFTRSLGVSCTHCHAAGKWESDEKPQKQIAREMMMMVGKIRETIGGIEALGNKNPRVGCNTCHRGQAKPGM
jgi:hypothetical protein